MVYIALFVGAFLLLFCNLDGRLFWGDEAETATLARNVLRFGIPRTFDGANRLSLYGAGFDANAHDVWTWSPWLQQYIAAAGFYMFGPTTWAGRVLFALVAWGSLGLLALVAWRIYRDHRVAIAASLLVATSDVFLLHARQCRYYSVSVLGEILFIYGIYQLLAGKRAGTWTLSLALVLQFYSNYIVAAANLPLLAPLAWTLCKKQKPMAFRVVLSVVLLCVCAIPWVLYAHSWRQSGALTHQNLAWKAWYYLSEFNFHLMPWSFLLLPAAGVLVRRRLARTNKATVGRELEAATKTGACPVNKPGTSAESPETIRPFEIHLSLLLPLYILVILAPPGTFIRYLLPLLPVACLLGAAWVFRYVRRMSLAMGLVGVQCACNLFAIAPFYPLKGEHTFRWPFIEYVTHFTRPYTDRCADVVGFLNQAAKPGQTVAVSDPEFPLKFYTPLRVLDARFETITQPLPEWILSESASGVVNQHPLELPQVLAPFYEPITIQVHASPRRASIPEPDTWQYETTTNKAPFIIYRKK